MKQEYKSKRYKMEKIIIGLVLFFAINVASYSNWKQLNSGTENTLNEIYFPTENTGFAVGEKGTMLKTVDGGNSWTILEMETEHDIHDLFFFDSNVGCVVGDSGYFAQTTDGGSNWIISYLIEDDFLKLSSVCFTSTLIGYVGGSENFSSGIIFKTSDGGQSWTKTSIPESIFDINFTKIVFPEPQIGYAITRGMCMKTVDAGDNWFITDTNLVKSGDMFSILEDVHFFSADTGFIVGWYNPFCAYTTNGGENWIDQFVLHNQWYSIDFPSRQIGYLAGWGQMAKTTDGGLSWTEISIAQNLAANIYSISFANDSVGFACGDNGMIIKTINGGTTGIEELNLAGNINIYPNPSNGLFTIDSAQDVIEFSNSMNLEVYNLSGQLVLETILTYPFMAFKLTNLPNGTYIVKIFNGENIYTEKVILQ
ncbi:MAG: hypothetical protein CVV22_11520 [Ignavibacteriae bacterium HGW-Ignavibacteriae-1]|nr:MAG: hypothetical protein CVV22_11520 [Ignavibacteriae bacterium HGW-Ignavibacteriae-1]